MNAENKMLHGKRKGFSLVEILIVLVILAIISGGGMMTVGKSSEKAKYVTAQKDLDIIQQAFIQYYNVVGNYDGVTTGKDLAEAFSDDSKMNILQSFFGKNLANWTDPWGNQYKMAVSELSGGKGVIAVYCDADGATALTSTTIGSGSTQVTLSNVRSDTTSNASGDEMPMFRIIYNVTF